MSLISASARLRVAGFFGGMTQRPSPVRSSMQYQTLSAPVTGRLLALQSTIRYASNSAMVATAYSLALQHITRVTICRSRSILTTSTVVATGTAVHLTMWGRLWLKTKLHRYRTSIVHGVMKEASVASLENRTTTLQCSSRPYPTSISPVANTTRYRAPQPLRKKQSCHTPQFPSRRGWRQFDLAAGACFELSSLVPLQGTSKSGVVNFKWLGNLDLRGGASGQT